MCTELELVLAMVLLGALMWVLIYLPDYLEALLDRIHRDDSDND
ncbi:hypothetical protein SAMN04487819_109211 [Actinopolyspora alba]|uniref:Uncharacterized protein n=1 Tax=Actinopolyspora alba TaxID=673379 RepID=A0A1I1YRW7_9ACTN|nr:hypothetical protein [Actinopolyspora alba]SFE22344.1 hypothetical protein SAMN04487819_109211 [Actinopolyspora alba]